MKSIVIEPNKVTLTLAIVSGVLTGLSLLEQAIGLTTGIFFLGADASIPTWYASIALLISALLLTLIAFDKWKKTAPYAAHWKWLAIIFYGLSIDEVAMLHERAGDAFEGTALQEKVTEFVTISPALEGVFHYVWVLIAVPLLAVFFLSYLRFVFHLPKQTRRLFILSAAIFLMGAIGMETLAGFQHYLEGYGTPTYILITTLEEFLEKIGIVLFIYALLKYVLESIGEIRISVDEVHYPKSRLRTAEERLQERQKIVR